MVYIFVFLGEFGYELLNWQGVIRKFSGAMGPQDKIVCCSRANLHALYEMADEYIDISAVPLFRRSRAAAYRAIFTPRPVGRRYVHYSALELALQVQLRRHVIAHSTTLRGRMLSWQFKQGLQSTDPSGCTFVFSWPSTRLNGCTFGYDREALQQYERDNPGGQARLQQHKVDIYGRLNIDNNVYCKIEPDLALRSAIEDKLGWSLTEPYVLVQNRKRDPSTKLMCAYTIPDERLTAALGKRTRTVLLAFDTGRWLDSRSSFGNHSGCFHYTCKTFPEQTCLIHFAQQCLFCTEGDFGSHIYVPPLLGKNVVAVASQHIFSSGSAPVEYWNQHVFQFGGQIIPWLAEDIFASKATLEGFVDAVLSLCE